MSQAEAFAPTQDRLDSLHSVQNRTEAQQLTHPGFIVSGALLAVAFALGHRFLPEQAILESLAILGGTLGGGVFGHGGRQSRPEENVTATGDGSGHYGGRFCGLMGESHIFCVAVFCARYLGCGYRASQMSQFSPRPVVCPDVYGLRLPVWRDYPRLVGGVSAQGAAPFLPFAALPL